MSKSVKSTALKLKSGGKARHIVVTLPDGVEVLRPSVKPTHFTERKIRETIRKVLREHSAVDADRLQQG